MSKKLVLHAALASMILGSSAPASALTARQALLAPAFVWLGISAYALNYQHPVANPQTKGEWKRILKAQQLLKKDERMAYLQNLSDVFWTRWVGQPFKDKEFKVDLKTGKAKQSDRKPATGVMGKLNTYLYTGVKTGTWLATLGGAFVFLTHPELFRNAGEYLMKKYGFAKESTNKLDALAEIRILEMNDVPEEEIARRFGVELPAAPRA